MAADSQLLMQFCREQDAKAFAELMDRHRPMVAATCRRYLLDAADLDDAIQDTFVRLARHAPEIRGEVAPWLRSVAARIAVDFTRRTLRERHRKRDWARLQNLDGQAETLWTQVSLRLQRAIAGLDAETQRLIIWRFYHDLPLQSIAEHDGMSTPTISRRVARAIEDLRAALGNDDCQDLRDAFLSSDRDAGTFHLDPDNREGVLWTQAKNEAPDATSPRDASIIRVGYLLSHTSTRYCTYEGYLPPIEHQLKFFPAFNLANVRLFGIVEPDSAGMPDVERAIRLGGLTAGMIDASNTEALELLDVIVLSHSYALTSPVVRAITHAVESGVGLYNEGNVGDVVPGVDDPRICRWMLCERAAKFHVPGHAQTMQATVLQNHPIIRGLSTGDHLQVYGCGTLCIPRLGGARVLIEKDTPVNPMFPQISELRQTRMPVLTIGELGRGRVAIVQDSKTLAAHPAIRGGFLQNTLEWLAEPRLHRREKRRARR